MSIKLVGPAKIPSIGFGTFRVQGAGTANIVEAALAEGYTHIDTAQVYENEEEVGAGIAHSSVTRDRIFLTTKIFPERFAPDAFKAATEQSLRKLGTDYVDLMLLHWPSRTVPIEDTIGALNDMIAAGKVRHGGVSNFTIAMTDTARAALNTPLAANQVEMHPFIDQSKLLGHLASISVPFEAYSPLALGKVVDDQVLNDIASAHGVSAVQVSLAWILTKPGAVVLPKTSTASRLRSNLAAAELKLTAEEIRRIDELASPEGRITSPESLAPNWD